MKGESNHGELESDLKLVKPLTSPLLVNNLVSLSFIVGITKVIYVMPSY